MKYFYQFLLYATRFELWLARRAPVRNTDHIKQLQKDESEYQHSLLMTELNT
jgi:hypothetical protein